MDGTLVKSLFAKNLKMTRKKLKITQAELADKIGVSTSFIGEIEVCKKFPSPPNIEKIANALGMKPYQLFYEETQNNSDDSIRSILPKIREELSESMKNDIDKVIFKYLKDH